MSTGKQPSAALVCSHSFQLLVPTTDQISDVLMEAIDLQSLKCLDHRERDTTCSHTRVSLGRAVH